MVVAVAPSVLEEEEEVEELERGGDGEDGWRCHICGK